MPPPRPAARSFRDLLVWRKAHEFVLAVYGITASFPRQETYGLALQNAARGGLGIGQYRGGIPPSWQDRQARFMNLAEGSLEECRYYLILVQDLGYGDTTKLSATAEEVSRLLHAYTAAILTPGS